MESSRRIPVTFLNTICLFIIIRMYLFVILYCVWLLYFVYVATYVIFKSVYIVKYNEKRMPGLTTRD